MKTKRSRLFSKQVIGGKPFISFRPFSKGNAHHYPLLLITISKVPFITAEPADLNFDRARGSDIQTVFSPGTSDRVGTGVARLRDSFFLLVGNMFLTAKREVSLTVFLGRIRGQQIFARIAAGPAAIFRGPLAMLISVSKMQGCLVFAALVIRRERRFRAMRGQHRVPNFPRDFVHRLATRLSSRLLFSPAARFRQKRRRSCPRCLSRAPSGERTLVSTT